MTTIHIHTVWHYVYFNKANTTIYDLFHYLAYITYLVRIGIYLV